MTAAATWTSVVWETPEFREELREFVVSAVGPSATLETVKIRPWSAVWRVTDGREVWFAIKSDGSPAFGVTVQTVFDVTFMKARMSIALHRADPIEDDVSLVRSRPPAPARVLPFPPPAPPPTQSDDVPQPVRHR